MKLLQFICFAALTIFSVALMAAEWNHNITWLDAVCASEFQSWNAVNSTLVIFLFWAASLLFAICLVWTEIDRISGERFCYKFHLGLGIVLGCYERFLGPGFIQNTLCIDPLFMLVALGIVVFFILVILDPVFQAAEGAKSWLRRAWFCWFGLVFFYVFQDIFPIAWFSSTSLRHLMKTWLAVCFFMVAWKTMIARSNGLKEIRHDLTTRVVIRRTQAENEAAVAKIS